MAEGKAGETVRARGLFQRATEAQPDAAPAWQVSIGAAAIRAGPCLFYTSIYPAVLRTFLCVVQTSEQRNLPHAEV